MWKVSLFWQLKQSTDKSNNKPENLHVNFEEKKKASISVVTMEAIKEMFQFLTLKSRPELKSVALDSILGLTATSDGLQVLTESESEIFNMLAEIALKDPSDLQQLQGLALLVESLARKPLAS